MCQKSKPLNSNTDSIEQLTYRYILSRMEPSGCGINLLPASDVENSFDTATTTIIENDTDEPPIIAAASMVPTTGIDVNMIVATAELVLDEGVDPRMSSFKTRELDSSHLSVSRDRLHEVPVKSAPPTSVASKPSTPTKYMPRFKDQSDDIYPNNQILLSSRNVQVETNVETSNNATTTTCVGSTTNQINNNYSNDESASTSLTEDQVLQYLRDDGFPKGLAQHLFASKQSCPLRFWYLDNSASMYKADCRRLVQDQATNDAQVVMCTRWTELKESLMHQVRLASVLGAQNYFRFLNHENYKESQEFVVHQCSDTDNALHRLESTCPDGVSLLTKNILELRDRIAEHESELINNGQKALVVLATDGAPSDEYGESSETVREEYAKAIKALQLLPVFLVIRICSNERSVLNFYRRLDKQLERPVDVVGDFLNEAKEIHRLNKWLNYCLPLHRAREMGIPHRLFDLLDERPFTKDELGEFLVVVYGKEAFENAPNMYTDWDGFVAYFEANVLGGNDLFWNPCSNKMECLINVKKLKASYAGGIRERCDSIVLGVQRAFSRDVI